MGTRQRQDLADMIAGIQERCGNGVSRTLMTLGAFTVTFAVLGGGTLHAQSKLDSAFIENRGQWNAPVAYIGQVDDHFVAVDASGLWLHRYKSDGEGRASREVVRLTFEGLGSNARVLGVGALSGTHHYFLGDDPARWRTSVKRFKRVMIEADRLSISISRRSEGAGLAFTIKIKSGVPPASISVSIDGLDGPIQDHDGGLVLRGDRSELVFEKPRAALEGRHPVPVQGLRFQPVGPQRALLAMPNWGQGQDDIIVHAGLEWSTLLGGLEFGSAVAGLAIDSQGDVIVAGDTSSPDFPATPGAFQETLETGNPALDVYVARFSSDGSQLIAATFLGGSAFDQCTSFALAPDGSAVVGGFTFSADFPTTQESWDTTFGFVDGFVAKLSPAGDQLVYGTAVGGGGDDIVGSLSITDDGRVLVIGSTLSSDFPTHPGGFDQSFDAVQGNESFLIRLLEDGSDIDYATFFSALGGPDGAGGTEANRCFVEEDGKLVVVGTTSSREFAAETILGAAPSGLVDVFITRFDSTWTVPETSVLFGATGSVGVYGADRSAAGDVVIIGRTSSTDFPTTSDAFMTMKSGLSDAVVTCVDSSLSEVKFSTYLGGLSDDHPWNVAFDDSGVVTVAGMTLSGDFPITPGALQVTNEVGSDAWVARFDPSGRRLLYSTTLGGSDGESFSTRMGLALDPSGSAIVGGATFTGDTFPTTPGAFQTTGGGHILAFITKLTMLPEGIARYGSSSPGCSPAFTIGAASGPFVGQADFALTCVGAPPLSGQGLLALSALPLNVPETIVGVAAWVDLSSAAFLSVRSTDRGFALARLPVPGNAALAGVLVGAQFFWPDACAGQGWSASDALAITVQP